MHLNKRLDSLKKAVESGIVEDTKKIVTLLIHDKVDGETILEKGLIPGINAVVDKFAALEAFLPDIIFSAEAMHAGIEIIKENLTDKESGSFNKGTVVIGTMQGDIHDVGKTIVASLLTANGFLVYDLGLDVSAEEFIRRAKNLEADIIALSCLMTTTMARQKEVIEDLKRLGLRDTFKVLVGGGAITQTWAEEIGADGYGEDAIETVKVALKLIARPE